MVQASQVLLQQSGKAIFLFGPGIVHVETGMGVRQTFATKLESHYCFITVILNYRAANMLTFPPAR